MTKCASTSPGPESLTPEFLEEVRGVLRAGEPLRRRLPGKGQLHIDRQLPFIFVYRRPPGDEDPGTERLIRSEASYLIAPGDAEHHRWVSKLLRHVGQILSAEFGAFLVVEVWSRREAAEMDGEWGAHFRVVTARSAPPDSTVETFQKWLGRIALHQKRSLVETARERGPGPPGLPALLPAADRKALSASVVGLEVSPVYRDPQTGDVFPLALRTLRRQFSRALKRAAHAFALSRTTHTPSSYLALGRRDFVKAVLDVDRQLASIGDSFDFILDVTPVDVDRGWSEFQRRSFDQEPRFTYRPLSVDPLLLKRELFAMPAERIEDPVLEQIFREKQMELDRTLTMLLDRGTRRFLYGSLQLYGTPDDELVDLAREILKRVPARTRDEGGKPLTARQFAAAARREVEHYRRSNPDLASRVEIRDDVYAGMLVSQGHLLIGEKATVPRSRVQALIQHEIGTHVLTYANGRAQPLRILYGGLVGYEELQEGLAVLSEYLVGGLGRPRLRLLAARVLAAKWLVDGGSFVDTFRTLNREHEFQKRLAFNIAMRVFRGGGLTKDMIYLRGLARILKYVADGNDLEPLYVGKIAHRHLSVIKELQMREVLRPAPMRPRYLEDPGALERLGRLREGCSVLDIVRSIEEE